MNDSGTLWSGCKNCGLVCKGVWWCETCRKELSSIDKWYLIGFYNLWDANFSLLPSEKEAYELGQLDRHGTD